MGWDAVDLRGNFLVCLVVGAGGGDTTVSFGIERVSGPRWLHKGYGSIFFF